MWQAVRFKWIQIRQSEKVTDTYNSLSFLQEVPHWWTVIARE